MALPGFPYQLGNASLVCFGIQLFLKILFLTFLPSPLLLLPSSLSSFLPPFLEMESHFVALGSLELLIDQDGLDI